MHKTWKKYQGCLSAVWFSALLSPKEMGFILRTLQRALTLVMWNYFSFLLYWQQSVTESVRFHLSMRCLMQFHHPMHSYKCQELCVFEVCLTLNIYSAQQRSTQSFLIASLQSCGSWCVKSHWLQFAISPGTCNIAFRFPSSAGTAGAQINSDILQWGVRFVCVS